MKRNELVSKMSSISEKISKVKIEQTKKYNKIREEIFRNPLFDPVIDYSFQVSETPEDFFEVYAYLSDLKKNMEANRGNYLGIFESVMEWAQVKPENLYRPGILLTIGKIGDSGHVILKHYEKYYDDGSVSLNLGKKIVRRSIDHFEGRPMVEDTNYRFRIRIHKGHLEVLPEIGGMSSPKPFSFSYGKEDIIKIQEGLTKIPKSKMEEMFKILDKNLW